MRKHLKKNFQTSAFFVLCLLTCNVIGENKDWHAFPKTKKLLAKAVVKPTLIKKVGVNFFYADIKNGVIGSADSSHADNPYDNAFHVFLPKAPSENEMVSLHYNLKGLADGNSVSRNINTSLSMGGYYITLNDKWTKQKEYIPTTTLHQGDNVIYFHGIPNLEYRVSDVVLQFEPSDNNEPVFVNSRVVYYHDKAYIRGILRTNGKLFCNNTPVSLRYNEFEFVLDKPQGLDNSFIAKFKVVLPSGKTVFKKVEFRKNSRADIIMPFENFGPMVEKGVVRNNLGFQITLKSNHFNSTVVIPADFSKNDLLISLSALRKSDVAIVSNDIVNVTGGAESYRIIAGKGNFRKKVRLNLPYDQKKIPEGYTQKDIRTFFFDNDKREWIALHPDSIDSRAQTINTFIDHSSDMITGIIKVPESPQTQGYTPTSIKDYKAADPSNGIVMIDAPKANNTGANSLSFPLKLPKGRLGLQPNLSIQYNHESANGWLGMGWNISVPSIAIDTRWGAPRYDLQNETETYLVSGEQLAPVSNRTVLVPRVANKQFHLRVEGSFKKIVRHGDRPANYWWEIIDKSGLRSFYGGTPDKGVLSGAVLKDGRGNIGQWQLVEIRDLHDNFVSYRYDVINDPGIPGGTVNGSQIYLSQINYTGTGEQTGPYQISFLRTSQTGAVKRKDIEISARLGFKMVTGERLELIRVGLNGQNIRSYRLDYSEGAFYKTLLREISEIDKDGEIFYSHNFDYFNEINHGTTLNVLGTSEGWKVTPDNIKGDFVNPLSGFSDESSVLGTVKSNSKGAALALTIGLSLGSKYEQDKSLTIGGSIGTESGNSEGLVSMVDINGDGLPDKVFKKNGGIYFRPNLGEKHAFGDMTLIAGINNLSKSTSSTLKKGVQVIPPFSFIGFENTTVTTKTTEYFSDFNGDGLVDLASEGLVYFNHLDANGNPVFELASTSTPNPILVSNYLDQSLFTPDKSLEKSREIQYPLQDAVRFWQAPFAGIVRIVAPVQLLPPASAGIIDPKNDGVTVAIETDNNRKWSTKINSGDYAIKTPVNVNNIVVKKGQKIYFRVQSYYNGNDDKVNWNPEIAYLNPVIAQRDANNRLVDYYKASDDFLLDRRGGIVMPKTGSIDIDGSFIKNITSDDVSVLIIRQRSGNSDTVLNQKYFANTPINSSINKKAIDISEKDLLYFKVQTDSYIDKTVVNWQPHYQFVAFADGTPVLNLNSTPLFEGIIVPDNSNYNNIELLGDGYVSSISDKAEIIPQCNLNSSANGDITFTVKGINKLYGKRTLKVTGGKIIPAAINLSLDIKANEPYYFDFATSDPDLTKAIDEAKISNQAKVVVKYKLRSDEVKAGLYVEPQINYLGSLYRGWGQFSYKGDKPTQPIDETKLNMDQYGNYPTDANSAKYQDTTALKSLPDPTLSDFVPMYADNKSNSWIGLDSSVFITASVASSSRLWLHDVASANLMQGNGLSSAFKIRVSEIKSFSLGGGFGPISASLGKSSATTTTELDMMDMNGDRYPDVLNTDNVQYTQPNGSLGATVDPAHHLGGAKSKGETDGATLGGHFSLAKSANFITGNSFSEASFANSIIGLSGNIGTNDEHGANTWLDVNGDGLPDKVFDDGVVALNLGYTFAAPENWGISAIDKNQSKSIGGGANAGAGGEAALSLIGKNIVSGSFEVGFGLSRSNSSGSYTLNDINGDGLVDQIYNDGVQINTGNGFGEKILWAGLSAFNNNVSTGESANAAFTIAIHIPILGIAGIKICINPSFFTQHGISRDQDQIMDIDGDGLPDILHSDNDGDLSVRRSLIGRTNLLSAVHRPMGSSFKVDYQRTGNNYNLPQNKWVLTTVTEFDGVSGDGPDSTQVNYIYKDGLYNRRERDFYGFASVQTNQLNTANKNEIYRSTIQEYFNDDYYTKGLIKKEWLQDATGKKFTETNNLYQIRTVQTDVAFPALVQTNRFVYEGEQSPGASTYTVFEYDDFGNVTQINDAGNNTAQDMVTADITYHDNASLYIKSIPKSIVVNTIEGEKRKRSTLINNFGDITEIDQYLANGTKSVFNLKYDSYGNLSQITRPANYKNERLFYAYEYDSVVKTYVSKATDAYGYTSTSEYEYLFGNVLRTISMSNEPMQFVIDNKGRIKSLAGPYEIAANKPYTISFDYHPEAATPYAVTHHYDPEYNGNIDIINFVDGFARSIQTKKMVSLFAGKNLADKLKIVVSGRTVYDAFGRGVTSYYPVIENIGVSNNKLNNDFGIKNETIKYDIQDRPLKQSLADGTTTSFVYTAGANLLTTKITDALQNVNELVSDIKDRKREELKLSGPTGPIATKFDYNALSELINVTDNSGNITSYTYDNLGRRISAKYPDAGETGFVYDPAGNLIKKITAQIKKEIPKDGAINYQYEFERLTGIDYPRQYQNKVTYKYGAPTMGDRAGRMILQEDASGGLEYYYGKLGEVTKQIRTVLINKVLFKTFVSEQTYDTWNRVKKMTYPDGEVVNYHYNKGGSLQSIDGLKLGNAYSYVDKLGYDEYEQRVFLRYGNKTETGYGYDSLRRRLTTLSAATTSGRLMMKNTYTYDAVSNILNITNAAKAEKGKLGGSITQDYKYDNLYRLINAKGKYKGDRDSAGYTLSMEYDNLYNIVNKKMLNQDARQSYNQAYAYSGAPHQATKIGPISYAFDLNGNSLGSNFQMNYWDEENRLMGVINNDILSEYTYDAGGERVIKSSGGLQGNWVNGSPAGTINHYDDYTVYVSPYLVYSKSKFTKHFYIEGERIASKIGTGSFTNNSFPQGAVSAGGINYTERAEDLQRQRIEYYKTLGVSPGPPTNKLFYAEPQNSGLAPPIALDNTASSIPAGWPGNTTPPVKGPPVYVQPIPSNDSVKAGYGFKDAGQLYEVNEYFYHPDHLGSTSYITNNLGEVSQHVEYSAFGETLLDERQGSLNTTYLFNAKEKDTETGYYYYGARYYDAHSSQWLIVDPMVDEYAGLSPYNYTLNSPVVLKDFNGEEPTTSQAGTAAGFVNTINTTGTKLGLKTGSIAHSALLDLGKTNFQFPRSMPINTERINLFDDKYIYTEKGGWIDMAHFMFYAGKAYKYKIDGEKQPIDKAMSLGHRQEISDLLFAKGSSFSYEDLPSDRLGADFGANYFDAKSKLNFGEQLKEYLNNLGAISPKKAPNYKYLPKIEPSSRPSRRNFTEKPVYIKNEP